MAISVLHTAHGGTFNNNVYTITITSTTAGSLLVVGICATQNGATNLSVIDDALNSYTHWAAADNEDNFALQNEFWDCPNAASGGTTLTITSGIGQTDQRQVFYWEIAGAKTASVRDAVGVNVANHVVDDPLSGSTVTPTDANAICLSIVNTADGGNGRPTAVSAPWTGFMEDHTGGDWCVAAHLLAGGASAQHPVFTGQSDVNNECCSSSVSYFPAATGSTPFDWMTASPDLPAQHKQVSVVPSGPMPGKGLN